MDFPQIDGIAVLAAAAVSIALGFAWYSKILFRDLWLASIGRANEDPKPTSVHFVVLILSVGLMAIGVAVLYAWLKGDGWLDGIKAGVFLYAVTVLPLKFTDLSLERRPWAHFWITAGFHLISFGAMGLVMGLIG